MTAQVFLSRTLETTRCRSNDLHIAAIQGDISSISCFIAQGLMNHSDFKGNSPLHWAVLENRIEVASLLIHAGAAIDLQNNEGETPLFLAVKYCHEILIALLCENGADVNLPNFDGVSVFHLASSLGAESVLHYLEQQGAFIFSKDEEGDTPMHYAVREGKQQSIRTILQQMSRLEALFSTYFVNNDGETPLDLAYQFGEHEIVSLLRSVPTLVESSLYCPKNEVTLDSDSIDCHYRIDADGAVTSLSLLHCSKAPRNLQFRYLY